MPILLSDAPGEMEQWTLGAPKCKNGQITISSINGKDGWPSVQLLSRDRLGEIYVPFEPSVFRGAGAEPRKGILFTVPQDVMDNLKAVEAWAQKQVSSLSPTWNSCLKEPGNHGCGVKAKINVSGPNACLIHDTEGNPIDMPESWNRLTVIPIIEVRGIYSQKTGSGLILDVTQLMIGNKKEPKQCKCL